MMMMGGFVLVVMIMVMMSGCDSCGDDDNKVN